MHYSSRPDSVRVDIWKNDGLKWYDTIELHWDRYASTDSTNFVETIHATFMRCMREQYPNKYRGMRATCLEPYHEHSHPICIEV